MIGGREHHIAMIQEGQINIFEAAYQFEKEREGSIVVQQATEKLQAEMKSKKNNAYVQVIGNFLVDYIQNNSAEASKIIAEGKTIEGSLTEMRKEAEKQKQGNCAVLTDEQGFKIVLGYYGIKANGSIPQTKNVVGNVAKDVEVETVIAEPTPRKKFEATLDEFL